MDKIDISNLFIGQTIQFITNINELFEGKIIKLYNDYFMAKIFIGQNGFSPIEQNKKTEFLIAQSKQAFKCISNVLGSKIEGNLQIIILDSPEIIKKIERRQYPRINIVMEAEYCMLPNSVEYKTIDDIPLFCYRQMKKTFTIDLSVNGVKIITYDDKLDSEYALLSLFIKEEIKILCCVVRQEYDDKNKNYKTALEFKDLDKSKWQKIRELISEKSSGK